MFVLEKSSFSVVIILLKEGMVFVNLSNYVFN